MNSDIQWNATFYANKWFINYHCFLYFCTNLSAYKVCYAFHKYLLQKPSIKLMQHKVFMQIWRINKQKL